ncbi:MAG: hypothetical protein KC635_08405, partial [Myxococcales bacterium]|nr:hypothetical protein [Myxococcales bacterium]
TTEPCPFGCAAGACAPDPCADVVCDSPPSACHAAAGTCSGGVCSYVLDDGAACDDGDACTTSDACLAGACGGAAISCVSPPPPTCSDAATRVTYAATGTCGAGTCSYAATATTCAHGCAGGACAMDPCAGVVCASPPPAVCLDGGATARTFAATGTCADGDCGYAATDAACPYGCAAGACTPPAGFLLSEVRYDTDGSPDVGAFVEIAGPPGASLAELHLVGVNGNGGADYNDLALSGVVPADGLLVIAHPSAPAALLAVADVTSSKADLQNGPDSVQLRWRGHVLDALAWGSFGAGDTPAGEGTPHPGHAVDASLARDAALTDTDDNAADFTAGPATPGERASACVGGEVACGDGCIGADDVCPVPLPEGACSTTAECGDGGTCHANLCVCRTTYLPCDGGCCPRRKESHDVAGVFGRATDAVLGADGRVYVAVRESSAARVYAVGADGASLTATPLGGTAKTSDVELAARSDGAILLARVDTAGRLGIWHATGDGSVDTVYFPASTQSSTQLALGVDADDTAWVLAAPN